MCPAYGLHREIVPPFPLFFVYFSRFYARLRVGTVVSAVDTEKPLFQPVISLSSVFYLPDATPNNHVPALVAVKTSGSRYLAARENIYGSIVEKQKVEESAG